MQRIKTPQDFEAVRLLAHNRPHSVLCAGGLRVSFLPRPKTSTVQGYEEFYVIPTQCA